MLFLVTIGGSGSPLIPTRRETARSGDGRVVAVVGSDGSGKSTLCRDLAQQLRLVGPVEAIYFGSGDGASSWLRWPLVQARRLLSPQPKHVRQKPLASPGSATPTNERTPMVAAARVVWALTLAWEKRGKLRRARRARARGRLVLCDRFPQAQVGGLMDGPLLHEWTQSRAGVRRTLADWEARPYRQAELEPPDLVLRLVVDQRHAEQRRPDHDPDDLRRRRRIVAALRFDGARYGVVDLDATMSAEDVLRTALCAIDSCRNGETVR